MKACRHCGVEFAPGTNANTHYHEACAIEARERYEDRAAHARELRRKNLPVPCVICGVAVPQPRHGTRLVCGTRCARDAMAIAQRGRYARNRDRLNELRREAVQRERAAVGIHTRKVAAALICERLAEWEAYHRRVRPFSVDAWQSRNDGVGVVR